MDSDEEITWGRLVLVPPATSPPASNNNNNNNNNSYPSVIALNKTPYIIGRIPTSDFVVERNPCISSLHCLIVAPGQITDMSSNGVCINGAATRVPKGTTAPLCHNDVVDLVWVRKPDHDKYRLQYRFELAHNEARGVKRVVKRAREDDHDVNRSSPAPAPPPPTFEEMYTRSALCLGTGHFAQVWRGTRRRDGLNVAIKTITKSRFWGTGGVGGADPSENNNVEASLAFEREIGVLRRVRHPNIVTVHDVFDTKEHVHMVLELCEGGDLFDHVSRTRNGLDEAKARVLFRQLVSAVRYLHHKGIVHRDIKPENILLVEKDKDEIKLADFGLAKVFALVMSGSQSSPSTDNNNNTTFTKQQDLQLTTVCGTPMYVAPEVLDRSQKTYTSKVDVWSLGVLLFVTLTARSPLPKVRDEFGRATKRVDYSAELPFANARVWPRESRSRDVEDLIRHMLVVDPDERFSIDDVAAHPWVLLETKKEADDGST
eukprot:PhM_4_TR18593/c5_g1_i1/m.97011/K06641/CHK2; serine/threonine-protein kinase Chk2